MLTIDPRYNGPPGSGHGGVAAGHFAGPVDPRRAAVRFHAPIPLGRPLQDEPADDGAVTWTDEGQPIATVRPANEAPTVQPFERLDAGLIQAAAEHFAVEMLPTHPFPTCYGCGHSRHEHDGMELRPGAVPGHDLHATAWSPGRPGPLPLWRVWAVLDCPSAFPAMAELRPGMGVVTGEFAVDIGHAVPGDLDYQVISRLVGRDGRKSYCEAALVDPTGTTLAVATSTWIEIEL